MEEVIHVDRGDPLTIIKPDFCPHCHKGISPVVREQTILNNHDLFWLYVCFQCPVCQEAFFCSYSLNISNRFDVSRLSHKQLYYSQIIGGCGVVRTFPRK